MDILHKKLFVKLFPLDRIKIRQLSDADKDELIDIFLEAERDLDDMKRHLMFEGVFRPFPWFSALPYIAIIKDEENVINKDHIDIMNMMLYMEKYKFPLSLFLKPLIPTKYLEPIKRIK